MRKYVKENEYDALNYFGKNVRYLLSGWSDTKIKEELYPNYTAGARYVAEQVLADRRAYITTVMRVADYFGLSLDELVYEDLEKKFKSK